MKIAVIAILVFAALFNFLLKFMNYRNRNAPLPSNVKDVFDEAEYKKSKAYGAEGMRFGMFSGIITAAIGIVILATNLHSHFFYFAAENITSNYYLQFIFMFVVIWFIEMPISAVLDAIDTFVIEQKYGFNKTKPMTFIIDIFKDGLLTGVLLLGILSAFVALHIWLGNMVFIAFFFVLALVIVLIMFSSILQMRLFYKFTPLEEGSLRTRAEELGKTIGFPVKRILVLDASKRSTKSNAFFTGIGKTKTIGLFDTLLEKFTEDEILAILAHEMGHAKEKHFIKKMSLTLVSFVAVLALAFFIINSDAASLAFGFSGANTAFSMYITLILATPFLLILGIPSSILSRKYEYEADAYEVKYVGLEAAVSAIKKLYASDYGNLTPHPFVVFVSYSHPPLSQRLAAMEKKG